MKKNRAEIRKKKKVRKRITVHFDKKKLRLDIVFAELCSWHKKLMSI